MVNILVEKDVIKELILDLCFSELIDICMGRKILLMPLQKVGNL